MAYVDIDTLYEEQGKEKIEVILAKLDESLVSEVEEFATSKMLEAIQIKDKLRSCLKTFFRKNCPYIENLQMQYLDQKKRSIHKNAQNR